MQISLTKTSRIKFIECGVSYLFSCLVNLSPLLCPPFQFVVLGLLAATRYRFDINDQLVTTGYLDCYRDFFILISNIDFCLEKKKSFKRKLNDLGLGMAS